MIRSLAQHYFGINLLPNGGVNRAAVNCEKPSSLANAKPADSAPVQRFDNQ